MAAHFSFINVRYECFPPFTRHTTIVLFSLLITSLLNAKTINVPQHFGKIQTAINAAVNGDTILVSDGTYTENLLLNKKITVASYYIIDKNDDHIANTIIKGNIPTHPDTGSVITIGHDTDSNTVVVGFTITGGTGNKHKNIYVEGYTVQSGGGIDVNRGGATIRNNIIKDNTVSLSPPVNEGYGGGICFIDYDPNLKNKYTIIEDNIISNNAVTGGNVSAGGGIEFWATPGRIVNNKVIGNMSMLAAGMEMGNPGVTDILSVEIRGNLFQSNVATKNIGAFYTGGRGLIVSIQSNIIIDNIARQYRGGISIGDTCTATVERNYISNNYSLVGGNGIHIFRTNRNTLVTNNIITNHYGYAIVLGTNSELSTSNAVIVNNTITGNTGGLNVSIPSKSTAYLVNNIFKNSGPIEILGSAFASHNIIQGRTVENNNIDIDPYFVSEDSLYRLSDSSYGLARGTEMVVFDSVTVYAPTIDFLGAKRSQPLGTPPDMGAIEHQQGIPRIPLPFPQGRMGPKFRLFFSRLLNAETTNRPAIIDSFFTENPNMPFIEDSIVHFLYRGSEATVYLGGGFNDWDYGSEKMNRISGTDLRYSIRFFEYDARFEYRFLLDGVRTILDPKNSQIYDDGTEMHSEVILPKYIQPPEIDYYGDIPHGELNEALISSNILSNIRLMKVYTPPGYNPTSTIRYPVALFHDGYEYVTRANAINTLDYLIYHKRIEPMIAVFLPPVNQDSEYATTLSDLFSNFIITEVMPFVDLNYNTNSDPKKRASIGRSPSGLFSANISYHHPEMFGLAGLMSTEFWQNSYAVFHAIAYGPKHDVKYYVDCGSYEGFVINPNRTFRDALKAKGYEFTWKEWHEGESWGNWRAHLDNVLEYLFPGSAVSVQSASDISKEFSLQQNFPNPFNPSTTIQYALPFSASVKLIIYDILGREIKTLVNEHQTAGRKEVKWNATSVASGMYYYKFSSGAYNDVKKMMVVK